MRHILLTYKLQTTEDKSTIRRKALVRHILSLCAIDYVS
jgi:hypothetical protein